MQYTLEQLVDILEFKREVMNQVPIVSSLLAGVATSGAIFLAQSAERSKLRSWLLTIFTMSALLFVLATLLDVTIMPAMKRSATLHSAEQIRGLLRLANVVVWAVLFGVVTLVGAVSMLGFLMTKRTGLVILAGAAALSVMLAACWVYLDRIMTM